MENERIYPLRMSDFTAPERSMDAFPAVRYEVPRVYRSDAVSITYAQDSAATVQLEAHTVYLEQGDILMMAPFCVHCSHIMQPGGGLLNVVLRPTRVETALPRLFQTDNPIRRFLERCTQPEGPLFLHLRAGGLDFDRAFFAEVADFCVHNSDPSRTALLLWENRLERVLLTLLTYPQIQGQEMELSEAGASRLSRILGYIQRNLDTVTLRQTAAALGWNESHLSRVIKQNTGRSFTDIVQVLRLDEASTLLERTDCSVEEIMERIGYTGKANFYAIFRQRFGSTPAKYRRTRRGA